MDPQSNPPDSASTPGLARAVSDSFSHLVADPAELLRIPCFKRALLWGGVCGGLIAAHRAHASRSVAKAVEHGILGVLAGSGLSWTTCRYTRSARQEKLDQALSGLNKLNEARRRQRDGAGPPTA